MHKSIRKSTLVAILGWMFRSTHAWDIDYRIPDTQYKSQKHILEYINPSFALLSDTYDFCSSPQGESRDRWLVALLIQMKLEHGNPIWHKPPSLSRRQPWLALPNPDLIIPQSTSLREMYICYLGIRTVVVCCFCHHDLTYHSSPLVCNQTTESLHADTLPIWGHGDFICAASQ